MRQKYDSLNESQNKSSSTLDPINSSSSNSNQEFFNKDIVLIAFLGVVWIILIILSNYENTSSSF
jgi:hypothetical protein